MVLNIELDRGHSTVALGYMLVTLTFGHCVSLTWDDITTKHD